MDTLLTDMKKFIANVTTLVEDYKKLEDQFHAVT
jgi:hypothetical protein